MKVSEALAMSQKWFDELKIGGLESHRLSLVGRTRGDQPDPKRMARWGYVRIDKPSQQIQLTVRFEQDCPLDFKVVKETGRIPHHCEVQICLVGPDECSAEDMLERLKFVQAVTEAGLRFQTEGLSFDWHGSEGIFLPLDGSDRHPDSHSTSCVCNRCEAEWKAVCPRCGRVCPFASHHGICGICGTSRWSCTCCTSTFTD